MEPENLLKEYPPNSMVVTGSLNRYLIGGRWFVITQLAVYTTYIPLIVLANWVIIYISPTTYIYPVTGKLHWQNVLNAKGKALLIAWPVLLPVLPWPSWCLWEVKAVRPRRDERVMKIDNFKLKHVHPRNWTWNLNRSPWKRRFLLETIIFQVLC